jgi:hypothetical protein
VKDPIFSIAQGFNRGLVIWLVCQYDGRQASYFQISTIKKKSIIPREARQARLFRDALVMRQRAGAGLCDRAFWLPFWRHKKEENL